MLCVFFLTVLVCSITEESTLVRRRPRTAREAADGIEDILMELPSRTLGV